MSLSETQEIMQFLQEIMALLNNVEFKTKKLNSEMPQTSRGLATFRELERVALRYVALARRIGVPTEVEKAMDAFSKLIILITMAHMSMNMLMRGTPAGWLLGFAGVAMTALSMGNPLEGY
jgi:hypothetical protein